MNFITEAVVKAVKTLYQTDINPADINLQETRKEFEGQVTLVTFPFTKVSRKSPEQTGNEIGEFLKNEVPEISAFNVIKGFLNISLADSFWLNKFYTEILTDSFTNFKPNGKKGLSDVGVRTDVTEALREGRGPVPGRVRPRRWPGPAAHPRRGDLRK